MNTTITLREYLNKKKVFVIPTYQRGYVWGKNRASETDSVSYLMETIENRFKSKSEIFLQGVTVNESKDEIVIIDGQQRTTCLYLLLKYLGFQGEFEINYEIRKESSEYLKEIKTEVSEQEDDDFQDIYFFKKSMRIIREKLSYLNDKEDFLKYILDNIKFLYINIPYPEQAVKVFTMMNGNKAHMKTEEIIKAELLRVASCGRGDYFDDDEIYHSFEWDNNMLRSRYAREWDKWLYWWNCDEVKKLFRCKNVMGLLIKTFYNDPKNELSFESFKKKYLDKSEPLQAKQTFDKLRRLQKRFEDAFNEPISYNKIGAILRILDSKNSHKFIHSYFNKEDNTQSIDLDKYYKCVFLDMTHDQIMDLLKDGKSDAYDEKFEIKLKCIEDDLAYTYISYREDLFRLLLRLNIDQDCKQNQNQEIDAHKGRKFDFGIWDNGNRSLEHIYPRSKVWHIKDDKKLNGEDEELQDNNIDSTYISRDSIEYRLEDNSTITTSEHSIGNLVLLYKNENSSLGASPFEGKKAMFFNPDIKEYFNSRHLLHTIYAFSKSVWNGATIAENKYKTIKEFKDYYGK